jgi:hypothetical protein
VTPATRHGAALLEAPAAAEPEHVVYPDVDWRSDWRPDWQPELFGGSPTIAGELGQLALFAARAGYDDTAATFARWAGHEALAFFRRMDRKLGRPYECWRDPG